MTGRSFHYDGPSVAPKYAREIDIQAACRAHVEALFEARMIAVPNGTWTPSHAARGRAKKEGVMRGFPDCIIIGEGNNFGRIAFAEIKASTSLSEHQEAALDWLTTHGHDAGCFRHHDTLAAFLRKKGWV